MTALHSVSCYDCTQEATHLTYTEEKQWQFSCLNKEHSSGLHQYDVALDSLATGNSALDWWIHLEEKPWFTESRGSWLSQISKLIYPSA